jgi:hypothetical protein
MYWGAGALTSDNFSLTFESFCQFARGSLEEAEPSLAAKLKQSHTRYKTCGQGSRCSSPDWRRPLQKSGTRKLLPSAMSSGYVCLCLCLCLCLCVCLCLLLCLCLCACLSSRVQPVFAFFASQTLHNRKKSKKKSGEVKDSVFPPHFFELHKLHNPMLPPCPSLYVCMYTYVYMYVCMCVCTHTRTHHTHTHTHTHQTHTQAQRQRDPLQLLYVCVCIYGCMCVCMYIHVTS